MTLRFVCFCEILNGIVTFNENSIFHNIKKTLITVVEPKRADKIIYQAKVLKKRETQKACVW